MRRKDKAIHNGDLINLLSRGEYGVLSTVNADTQPYGVPLNYVYLDGHLYFHCALVGHKLDNLTANSKVCFCVVGRTHVLPAEFSTEFESVIAFGMASIVHGEERYRALMGLVEKYSPDFIDEGRAYIERFDKQTCVVRIVIDRMSGKAKRATGM